MTSIVITGSTTKNLWELHLEDVLDTLNNAGLSSNGDLNNFVRYLVNVAGFDTEVAEDLGEIAQVFTVFIPDSGYFVNSPRKTAYAVETATTPLAAILSNMGSQVSYSTSTLFSDFIDDVKKYGVDFLIVQDSPAQPFSNAHFLNGLLTLYTNYTGAVIGTMAFNACIEINDAGNAISVASKKLSEIQAPFTPIHWGGFVTTDGFMGASFGKAAIHDVMDPLSAQDAATKHYVDAKVAYMNQSLTIQERQIAQLYAYFFVSNPNSVITPVLPAPAIIQDLATPEIEESEGDP